MSIGKKILAAFAAASMTLAVGAFSASAVGLGETAEGVKPFTTDGSEAITITVPLDEDYYFGDMTMTAYFPAGMLPSGSYTLYAKTVVDHKIDARYYYAFHSGIVTDDCVIVDIVLYDADGNAIHDVTPVLTLRTSNSSFINAVAVYEDGEYDSILELHDDEEQRYTFTFTAPHLSRFIFAHLMHETSGGQESISPPISEPDDSTPETDPPVSDKSNTDHSVTVSDTSAVKPTGKDDVKTGDSGNTAVIVLVMGIAALGISLAAVKMKKSSK